MYSTTMFGSLSAVRIARPESRAKHDLRQVHGTCGASARGPAAGVSRTSGCRVHRVQLHGASRASARRVASTARRVSCNCTVPAAERDPNAPTGPSASPTLAAMSDADAFRVARDLLLACRGDDARAQREFAWPALTEFNWALDWFDAVPPRDGVALHVVTQGSGEAKLTFGELSEASDRLAN